MDVLWLPAMQAMQQENYYRTRKLAFPRNLTGMRIGEWLVLAYRSTNKWGDTVWLSMCKCGDVKDVTRTSFRTGSRSCRKCCNRTHGMSKTPEYRAWIDMHRRTREANSGRGKYWADRGIQVCARWDNFEAFFEDMGQRPDGGKREFSVGRIDNDLDYSPGNCRWETIEQQSNNKSDNRRFTYQGKTLTVAQWARQVGMAYGLLEDRLVRYGWPIGKALTTPKAAHVQRPH